MNAFFSKEKKKYLTKEQATSAEHIIFDFKITKVSWCPTRHGLLANSVRDSG